MKSATTHAGFRAGELDLLSVIEAVIARRPRVLKNGLPNLAFFRAANEVLAQPDDEARGHGFSQIEFWLTLARESDLLRVDDSELSPSPAADAYFALPFEKRRERMREAFLDSRNLNDFALVPELELPGLRKAGTVDVVTDAPDTAARMAARRTVLEFLGRCEGETSAGKLVQMIMQGQASFVIDHSDDGSWRKVFYRGIRERGAREDMEREGNWDRVEGAYIRWLLSLPLARLGWGDFDPARGVFEPLDEYEAEPHFEVIVQPNFEVLALGDRLDAAALWQIARFARPQATPGVRKYVLEKKAFTDALGRGRGADEVVALLASLSHKPLPQNVRFSLDEWGASSERLKIWPDALLVEAEGVEDLGALLSQPAREALGLSHIGGGHLVGVSPDAGALRKLLPARRTVLDYDRRLPPVIAPQQGLRLHAPAETLHLRARQLLESIARRQSADYWTLDPVLVGRAAEAVGAEALRRRVEEALSRPLEAAHALALRGWSGEFAAPFAGTAEVFLCDNEAQAHLIETLPRFAPWLDRKLGRGAYLLRAGGGEHVRKLLNSIGIKTRDSTRPQESK